MSSTVLSQQLASVLRSVMQIDVGRLEILMQEAHESTARQMGDPPELFPVSRQAIRMFWHFRCNLESVDLFPEAAKDV